ncbi:response regulator [Pseudoalteromonas ardens]|uniref:Histidine kinase n=1 Tax=Pseudoalteromonas rubra TaxID=43658 RepID=A0A0L0ESW2_9GAMM|nr:response regulator [Pseudoalteromonas sp. R96]KNC67496.1 histidine kinase [Pseudoalteromonas rubra]MDK1310632.1 response regulator [Pseudoalteromonas sp. R96]
MTANSPNHAQRRPQVVVMCDKTDELTGVIEIVEAHTEAYRIVFHWEETAELIVEANPAIIIMAKNDVTSSIETYTELSKQGLLNYPHKNILLCENKESGIAFKCCMKDIFSDYFVHKPMYENYRFRMILHNALNEVSGSNKNAQLQEAHFGKIDDKLRGLIDEVAQHRATSAENFAQTRDQIAQQQGHNDVQKQMFDQLKEQHINPLMEQLEHQLTASVELLKSQLKDKQVSLAELSALLTEKRVPRSVVAAQTQSDKPTLDAHEPASPLSQPPEQETTRKMRILVVEDNEIYREMLLKILREEDHVTEYATTGLEAIKLLRKKKFDMVFMDLFMPELDGYNTTRNIRTFKHCKKLPIIALSTNRNKELIRKWASLGLTGYITKPSTKLAILKAIDKVQSSNNPVH